MRYLDHAVRNRPLSEFQRAGSGQLETSFTGEIRAKKELNPKSAGLLKSHVYQGPDDLSHRRIPPGRTEQDFVTQGSMSQRMKAEFAATARREVQQRTGFPDASSMVRWAFEYAGIDRNSDALLTGSQVRETLQRLNLQPTSQKVQHPNFVMPTPYEMNDLRLSAFDPGGRERPENFTGGWDDVAFASHQRVARIAEKQPQGVSKNQARMYTATDGAQQYFVKGGSPREVAMERATFGIAQRLGLAGNFLPIDTREVGGEHYMISPFLPGKDLKAALADGTALNHPAVQNMSDQELAGLFLFDWVRNETDRNVGNARLGNDGRMYGIDNESSLGSTTKLPKGIIKSNLKNGVPISGQGVSRTGSENAFLTLLCRRNGIDTKSLKSEQLAQATEALPFPTALAKKLIQEEAHIVQDLQALGINSQFFEEGMEMLKDIVNKGDDMTLADLLVPSGIKRPSLAGDALSQKTDELFAAFGNG